jgi:Abortive infection alpha
MADPLTILGISYVGKEAISIVGQFTRDIFGPSARAIGEGMAAPLREWARHRAERAERLIVDAALTADSMGGVAHPVPGRVLLPILEHGSLEEDEALRQKWVRLLASAAVTPEVIPPMYPAILAELSPTDARLLDWIHGAQPGDQGKTIQRAIDELGISLDAATLSIANLDRLRLVVLNIPTLIKDSVEQHLLTIPYLSTIGVAFVQACNPER